VGDIAVLPVEAGVPVLEAVVPVAWASALWNDVDAGVVLPVALVVEALLLAAAGLKAVWSALSSL
jgi:hypothetical protein